MTDERLGMNSSGIVARNGTPIGRTTMPEVSHDTLSSLVSDLSFWELGTIQEDVGSETSMGKKKVVPRPNRRTEVEEEKKTDKTYDYTPSPSSRQGYATSDMPSTDSKEKKEPAKTVWRAAVDASTGRTYYYDSVTRRTQWEKPDEIRALERKVRKEKRRQDQIFFEEVKRNVMSSLDRGELIPGIRPSQEERVVMQHQPAAEMEIDEDEMPMPQPLRVRTISGMNEQLLAQFSSNGPTRNTVAHRPAQPPGSSSGSVEGRPPLPQRGRVQQTSTQDSMELSPDGNVNKGTPDSQAETETLHGIDLLDGPILDPSGSVDMVDADPVRQVRPGGDPLPVAHVRRNTGGTIYVQSTMENPDVNATIKCVCGVYRAHIVQSANQTNQQSPVSVVVEVPVDVFRDDFDVPSRGMKKRAVVPTLEEIELFYQDFYRRSQMEHDTIIMSLIYVERLIKETNGAMAPTPRNWRSVLFSCMVLSSKVWDDLSMFNLDFSNVSMASGLSAFTLQRTNALELAVLQALNFDVKVPASEYAKYYFLIRTMLLRSGLVEAGSDAHMPLRKELGGKVLEMRTLRYQDSKLKGQHKRRAQSMDWRFFGQEIEPVLKDTVCLEQIVSMDR